MDGSAPRVVFIDGIPLVAENGRFRLLASPAPCHGYANLCTCKTCLEREKGPKKAPLAPRQPWELAA